MTKTGLEIPHITASIVCDLRFLREKKKKINVNRFPAVAPHITLPEPATPSTWALRTTLTCALVAVRRAHHCCAVVAVS